MNGPQSTPQGPAPQAPRRKSRRILLIAASVLTLAATGTTAWFSFAGRGDSRDKPGDITAAAARMEARKVLAAFLAASSAENRASHVIAGEKLLPLMQAWYSSHETESLTLDAFQEPGWTFNSPGSGLVALECPRDRGRSPIVACFKRSDSGEWQMDWEIWTQTLDGQFRSFINRPAEGEHTLRARLTRSQSDNGMKITVADPFDMAQSLEFDITRADLQALYKRDLPEAGGRTATVQLVWLNDPLSGTLSPSLRRHICWGYPGLDGHEPEAVVVNMVSKNRPPAGVSPVPPPAVLATSKKIDTAVKTALAPATTGAMKTPPAPAPRKIETAQKEVLP